MDAGEIESIEARLVARQGKYPSPDEMETYIAKARHARNREIAAGFVRVVKTVKEFIREVRRVAASCTDARLRQHNV